MDNLCMFKASVGAGSMFAQYPRPRPYKHPCSPSIQAAFSDGRSLLPSDQPDPLLGDAIVDLALGHVEVLKQAALSHAFGTICDRFVEDLTAIVERLLMLHFARLQQQLVGLIHLDHRLLRGVDALRRDHGHDGADKW